MPHRITVVVLALIVVTSGLLAQAQITNVTNDTITPIEGVGHDYIKMMSETVNPANGGLNIHIEMPVAKSRGLTVPFSITYDSNNVHHLNQGIYNNWGTVGWYANSSLLGQGGWKFALPYAHLSSWIEPVAVLTGNSGASPVYSVFNCGNVSNYVMQDLSGVTHSLGIGWRSGGNGDPNNYCGASFSSPGSDGKVEGFLLPPFTGVQAYTPALTVNDDVGTVYKFSVAAFKPDGSTDANSYAALPDSIEDRNGNIARIAINSSNAVTVTDSSGRTSISTSGFGSSGSPDTVTVSGETFQVTWRTVSANFSIGQPVWAGFPGDPDPTYDNCVPPGSASDTQKVISQITLPNGKFYKFYYGNDVTPHNALTNNFGLVSEIDYPSGAWVLYSWKLSDTLNELVDYSGTYQQACYVCSASCTGVPTPCPGAVPDGCRYQYRTPVVASRQVSFGGSSPSLTQSFVYNTNWGSGSLPLAGWVSKTTTITTTDNTTGKSATTIYTYRPISVPPPPLTRNTVFPQIAVEQSEQYFDWNGTQLRTIAKDFQDPFDIILDQTTIPGGTGSVSSKKQYTYLTNNTFFKEPQETDEFDFGATSPTRKTVTTYQSFSGMPGTSGSPGALAGVPCKVVTTDGNGNAAAETDYLYDGGGTVCASESALTQPYPTAVTPSVPAGTHDSAFEGSTTPRANVTKIIKWLNGGTSPITAYSYDETGHVISATDACGNTSCSDMTGSSHTTQYFYSDAYTILSGTQNITYAPTNGNTNALLTKVIDPLGHISTFKYDYFSDQLTSLTDPNSRTTGYIYNDFFARPTQVNLPDGGQTTVAYNDAAYNPSVNTPSVTTTKTVTSGLNEVNIAAADGLGHVVRTILNSDPDGADTTDTTYDGLGRVLTQSNPHRSGASPTDGTTTYTYDALGRTTSVNKQDGSIVSTYYDETGTNPNSICTTVVDESGKIRKSCSDGLGRLLEVDEPSSNTTSGTPGAGTITVSGGPQPSYNPCQGNTAPAPTNCPQYDQGTVYVTIDGFTASATYGGPFNLSNTIASTLATGLNGSGSPVTAVASGNTISVTSKTIGADSNFPILSYTTWTTQQYASPSYTAGGSMSGGTDPGLGSNPLVTLYSYDTLNNLTCAVQKGTDTTQFTTCAAAPATWRPRSFVYDSLSRLTSATNPESGTITYAYDANGNVATKVQPKMNKIPADTSAPQTNTVSYFYDVENRLTKKSYSDNGSTVQYAYDGGTLSGCTYAVPTLADTNPIHRRTAMCDASGATHWALDITSGVGWKTTEARNINNVTKNIVTQNNFGGMTYQLTYPSGRTITYAAGGAGRYLSAIDSGNSINYAQGATYAPFGGLLTMTNGSGPITVTNAYNDRLQPATLSAATGANTLFSKTYDFHLASGDNGNVFQVINNLDSNRSQSFTYDALNRIATAQSAATSGTKCWGETFTIDAWGNLTNKATNKCTAETLNAPATNQNQISGYCYDKGGNLLGTSACPSLPYTATYLYDAENRLRTVPGSITYIYDAEGVRREKSNGTLYWGDGPLAESDLSGSATSWKEYIFFNGQRIARRDASNSTVHYFYSDHLGSSSVIVNATGTLPPEEDLDYFPYGGIAYGAASDHYEFTGKERDAESGLDNFGARYFTSSMGRFMTPDWAARPTAVPYAVFGDPQSLNLYNYVRNDPVSRADADGHCPPQTNGQQQNGCPQLTVTVKKDSEPHVMHGQQPNPDIAKVGTTTTVKVTDAKGAAVVGATVKENPVTTNNLTHTKGNNLANPQALTTSEKGTIKDVVAQQVVKEPTSTEEIQDHVNSTPYDRTTVQTLTITTQGPDGKACTCSATYSEHMTNVGPDGKLNEPNSSGVNYKLDIDPEVVQTTPQ